MKPANVPADATVLQPAAQFAFYQPDAIEDIQRQITQANADLSAAWTNLCNEWLLNNGRNRDLGQPIQTKPTPPSLAAVVTAHDDQQGSDTFGTVWIWQIQGSQLPACPDLPVIVINPPNTIHIGANIAGAWWQSLIGDTCPGGFTTPPGYTAGDGATGTFEKVKAPVGDGWWLRIGA